MSEPALLRLLAQEERQALCLRDEKVRASLVRLLRSRWPEARLKLFGSCAASLTVGDYSDVDLCFSLPEGALASEKQRRQAVFQIKSLLDRSRGAFVNIEAVAHARVPLVKCVDSQSGVCCDIVPAAEVAVENSALLAAYCRNHPMCRQLLLLVKLWAKRRSLTQARYGQLSSYGHVLTCIHFCLAGTSPPLIQDLLSPHLIDAADKYICHGFDVSFSKRAPTPPSSPVQTLSDLSIQYFEYMSRLHPHQSLSLRCRDGSFLLPKERWGLEGEKLETLMRRLSIEDPFETYDSRKAHDIGSSLMDEEYCRLRSEWERAGRLLRLCRIRPETASCIISELMCRVATAPAGTPKWVRGAEGRRFDDDRVAYTALEFFEYYGSKDGWKRWDAAVEELRQHSQEEAVDVGPKKLREILANEDEEEALKALEQLNLER